MKKVSKYWTLIEENGAAAALFNHRSHVLYFNYTWRPETGSLPINSSVELSQDDFYNKLEKIEK